MEHYKSRNNDFFHFTNPHDDISEMDDDDYDELRYYDLDDDRSCDFNFHNFRPIGITPSPPPTSQTSGVMNQTNTDTTSMEHATFHNRAFIFHLDNTMKNISDKLQHTIEDIDTRISNLEDETCKLDKHIDDVKNSAEKYHGTTHMKLMQMQNVLQEVQDGVLFIRDKHEIAETQLQLAKLKASKRNKVTAPPTNPQQQQPSNSLPFSQPVSYQPPPLFPHFTQSYPLNSFQGVISPQHRPLLSQISQETPKVSSFRYSSSVRSSRNYKSEFHAKYMPEFASNYNYTPVEPKPLPHVLPTADYVEDGSSSESSTIPVDDIIDKVASMGFRRDLVRASVRKLTENGSSVDLNLVLDRMMNNK